MWGGGGEWVGGEITSGRKPLRDDGGLDQVISCGEGGRRKWILSGCISEGRVNRNCPAVVRHV